jgi:hypothetical protein
LTRKLRDVHHQLIQMSDAALDQINRA